MAQKKVQWRRYCRCAELFNILIWKGPYGLAGPLLFFRLRTRHGEITSVPMIIIHLTHAGSPALIQVCCVESTAIKAPACVPHFNKPREGDVYKPF